MRVIATFVIALFLAWPTNAGEHFYDPFAKGEENLRLKYWSTLPPLPPQQRVAFDREIRRLYHHACGCFRFLSEGKVLEIKPPLTDANRRAIIDVIQYRLAIPLTPNGEGS